MNIYIIEGGVGRHIFFSALIPKLSEKDGKIITMSSYTDIFEGHPLVERSLGRGTPYMWKDLIKKEENNVYFADPYFNSDFIKGKIHVIEAWCRELNIKYSDTMKPEIHIPKRFEDDAKKFKQEQGDFIIVQFSSGQSPLNPDTSKPFQWEGFERNYSLEKSQELINKLGIQYPNLKIILFALPNEFTYQLQGKNLFKFNMPYLAYAGLLKESKGFIGVNSCLMHFAGALGIKGIGLWGGSSPDQWGYKIHTNIHGECSKNDLYCTRPYLRDLGDFIGNGSKWFCDRTTCMEISTDIIITELDKIIKG
jgi:ADP-heptose:LPS heptosyltransferase